MSNVTTTESIAADITKKKIAAPKGLMLVCAILALLLDCAVIVILLFNTFDFKFILCPALLLVLDIVYLINVVFSNYRFKYAINSTIIHVISIAVVSIFAFVSTGLLEDRIVFETFALIAMPAVHIIQSGVALTTALCASRTKKISAKIASIAICAVFILSAGIYARYVLTEGFFGQMADREQLTVVYELDESGDSYIVSGVLAGGGNTVTIPEEFNGKPVSGVNCELFASERIAYVIFDCAADIEFRNISSLNLVNDKIELLTSKSKLDTLRKVLYSFALLNPEILHLANHVTPSDLSSGEIYITFIYSRDALAIAKDNIMPTWFGRAGDKFNVYEHAAALPYVEHSNVDNVSHLYWCEQNQDSLIFRNVLNSEGESVNTLTPDTSMSANVSFDRIYRVVIGKDNDELYEFDKVFTSIETGDGTKDYKLAVADRVMKVLESAPSRNGFDLYWNGASGRLEDINAELATLEQSGSKTLNVTPVWDLRAPTIDTLTADGKSEGHSAIYGSDVKLNASATPPHSDILLKYHWEKDEFKEDTPSATIKNLHPTDKGEYKMTVTAYSPSSSLTKSVSKTVEVGFEKKTLNFTWSLPQDLVYSATEKTVNAHHSAADVINGDEITYELTLELTPQSGTDIIKNAGNYEVKVQLYDDADTKYQIPKKQNSIKFSILPYTVNAIWGSTVTFTYNAENHAPTAKATGIGSDVVTVKVNGEQKNVGQHTATAVSQNKNYVISADTANLPYVINPRAITAITWDASTFVYNAKEQSSAVSGLTGVIDKESKDVIKSLIYEGKNINVGNYTVNVLLPEGSNYYFSCDARMSYSITKKALTVTVNDAKTVYSGTVYTDFSFKTEGLCGSDLASEVFSISYKGAATTAVNASSQGYEISANLFGAQKYNNYSISVIPGTLVIERKALNIVINDVNKTYDGKVYPSSSFGFTTSGLCSTDTIDEVATVSFRGDATVEKNAGVWQIEASLVHREKFDNYSLTIVNGYLTINKAPLTVTAVGGSKVYDGTIFSGTGFTADGLVGGDQKSDLGSAYFGGAAVSTRTVGIHVLTVSLIQNSVNMNYEITYVPGSVEITKRPLIVTVHGASKVYNGQTGGSFSFTLGALASGDGQYSFSPKYTGPAAENKDVGVYEVSVEFAENNVTKNYEIEVIKGKLEITKKDITVSAANGSKVYDGLVGGAFDYNVSGLAYGDDKYCLGTATYSGSATKAKDVGSYALSVTLSGNGNYNITSYSSATYTIVKKQLTVTPFANAKDYDGKGFASFDFTLDGLCQGDTKDMLGKAKFGGSATTAVNAGSYLLNVSFDNNTLTKNYEIGYRTSYAVINQKEITVTAIATDRKYDGKVGGQFDFKVEGLADGETAAILGTPIYEGTAVNAKDVGSYVLNVRFADSAAARNYKITYVSDSFEIYEDGN